MGVGWRPSLCPGTMRRILFSRIRPYSELGFAGLAPMLFILGLLLMNPIEVGHGFRREVGHCSGMKPAIIPR
jgi:hypothetical protein